MKTLRISLLLVFVLPTLAIGQTNLTASVSVSCPCTIFGNTAPIITKSGPDKGIELGTQFTTSANGNIIALRFYKMLGATGTHTGSLWGSNTGLLATVTFTNETASGWQQQALPVAVPASAGTTYTVSYHTTNGYYARDAGFFASPVNNPPLQATGGSYVYSAGGVFPKTAESNNYYADVVLGHLVILNWGASATPNVLYNVYRSTTAGGENLTAPLIQGISGLTATDSSVVSGQTYYYKVTATLQSTPTNEISVAVPNP